MAVGAQILVAEALDDLAVTVVAGDHQQLLEQLWRLRQGVELARVDTAGDEVIAGALGGRLGQYRGLELVETVAVQVLVDGLVEFLV